MALMTHMFFLIGPWSSEHHGRLSAVNDLHEASRWKKICLAKHTWVQWSLNKWKHRLSTLGRRTFSSANPDGYSDRPRDVYI
ncbi:uncharacterized protein EV420DRAFT_1031552 [Desarmillaria tabescens]|uniref:Uncharacterized protein n=1 Tax=Armillaria tabescens TaxID=1929756 RepID=A0AA39T4J6_ARMTA|nr:uncharacterized protein EV420DRAFT_1031552 [Desarmillaria tabescens]KAK0464201.1 hypothetical protein EV420DRAFT_1031552 [Desarmillaria tabescens]